MNEAAELIRAWPAAELRHAEGGQQRLAGVGLDGVSLWPCEEEEALPTEQTWLAWPEGNRTLILDQPRIPHRGQPWLLSVKGVGARHPMFGAARAPQRERHLSAETWFGEAPWGAQGDEGVRTGLSITAEAGGDSLHGLPICPVLAAVRLPEAIVAGARPATYRRWGGGYWQELRLVPSRVRLAEQSDLTLAFQPEAALAALGVPHPAQDRGQALDAFIEELLRTGLCALTLTARSARAEPTGCSALVMDHVWLDKDAVVAPDGALCFADLEGLQRVVLSGPLALTERVRSQFHDHSYELLYAVDRLLGLWFQARGREPSPAALRQQLALRVELALAQDPLLSALPHPGGLDLLLRPPLHGHPPLRLNLLSE